MYIFKCISVYIDKNGKLIGIPTGVNPKHGGVTGLDIFFVLEPEYSDEELESFLEKVFDTCYSKEYTDDLPFAMQVYSKTKGPASAVKGYQSIYLNWHDDEGYTIIPLKPDKRYRGAFESIKSISIKVTLTNKCLPIEKGALATAFRTAIDIIEKYGN